MDKIDLDAKVEAERARLVRALRSLADRIERMPLERVSEALGTLAGMVDQVVQWVDRLLGGGGGGSKRAG